MQNLTEQNPGLQKSVFPIPGNPRLGASHLQPKLYMGEEKAPSSPVWTREMEGKGSLDWPQGGHTYRLAIRLFTLASDRSPCFLHSWSRKSVKSQLRGKKMMKRLGTEQEQWVPAQYPPSFRMKTVQGIRGKAEGRGAQELGHYVAVASCSCQGQ